jgi:hypothetical protein
MPLNLFHHYLVQNTFSAFDLFTHFSISGSGLECYVCTDQERNGDKCLNTIKTCEPDEDVCLSEIKWGSKWVCYNNIVEWMYKPKFS